MNNRIVTLVDMDCFYCQVEARLNPVLQGKPMAVVQYNEWKGGGIIAVNYEARDRGVTRYMRGAEAKTHCPEIELVKVPSVRGKADLTKYRDAGREVINVICEFSNCVQRASIDEAYIDLTEAVDKRLSLGEQVTAANLANSFIVGYSTQGNNNEEERSKGVEKWLSEVYDELNDIQSQRLALGARIVEEMRAAVYNKTGFRCSAGVAHNKILSKLVCGSHKPNRQTILPISGVTELFTDLPVQKVRNLGGKFGNDVIEKLGCKVMADLAKYSEMDLQCYFDEKTGTWLYNIARGIDLDPVTPRLVSKSIGCCKQFRGQNALKTKSAVVHWIGELAGEIAERLDEDAHMNKRKAQLLTVSVQQIINNKKTASSRSVALPSYEIEAISDVAFSAIKRHNSAPQSTEAWTPPLTFLGISVGKFVDDTCISSSKTINQYFNSNMFSGPSTSSVTNGVENIKSKQDTKHQNETEEPQENVCENDKNKGSFFERYFKNNKHLSNKLKNDLPFENKNTIIKNEFADPSTSVNNSSLNSTLTEESKLSRVDDAEDGETDTSTTKVKKSPYFETSLKESEVSSENDHTSNNENNSDEVWVSPSEIFPDLNNIDKDVMSLLPSPLQRKIAARFSKTDECQIVNITENKNIGENNSANYRSPDKSNSESTVFPLSRTNTDDSPSIPSTEFTITAQVHKANDSSSSINLIRQSIFNKNQKSNSNGLSNDGIKFCDNHDQETIISEVDRNNKNEDVIVSPDNELKSTTLKNSQGEKNSIGFKSQKRKVGECIKNTVTESTSGIEIFENSDSENEIVAQKSETYENSQTKQDIEILQGSNKLNTFVQEQTFQVCSYCKIDVSVFEYQEHVDHHIALELHQQLNSNQQTSNPVQNNPSKIQNNNKNVTKNTKKSPNKRKRNQPNNKNDVELRNKKSRSILSFFTKK